MSVPYAEIGVGAAFALLVIKEVRHWTVSLKNEKNSKEKARCADLPRCITAMDNNLLTTRSVQELEQSMKEVGKQSAQQTTLLKMAVETLKEIKNEVSK